ncbi:MAG TPA: FtsX-like permease family protein [Flavobacteriales bacterium]|nr:FtsX-like permease family protein [Flavobacteriales bacterium]
MSLKLDISIAKTHLFSRRRQTIVASLGVTFGIAMFILMISFMTGVNMLLEETTLTSTPHIRIYKDIETNSKTLLDEVSKNTFNVVHHIKPHDEQLNLKNGINIAALIEKDPAVMGVSPQITSQVFYNFGPTQLSGTIAGVNILSEDKLYGLRKKIKSGSLEALLSSNDGIIMGKGLADKLNVKTGDRIQITTPRGNTMSVKIVGTFKFGIGTIDNMRSYANISTVQTILQRNPGYITDIHIKLKDLNKATEFANTYAQQFAFKAEDWQTANATILISFTIRNVLTYVVVTTLLVVAGFGIYNIMNMTIYDKMKDIAILKATGFETINIIRVFIFQAVFIGVLGGLLGLLLGFIFSYALSQTPFDGGEFLSVDTFPVNMQLKYYIFGMMFGVVSTLLAGYFPARKASKIDPVNILRG